MQEDPMIKRVDSWFKRPALWDSWVRLATGRTSLKHPVAVAGQGLSFTIGIYKPRMAKVLCNVVGLSPRTSLLSRFGQHHSTRVLLKQIQRSRSSLPNPFLFNLNTAPLSESNIGIFVSSKVLFIDNQATAANRRCTIKIRFGILVAYYPFLGCLLDARVPEGFCKLPGLLVLGLLVLDLALASLWAHLRRQEWSKTMQTTVLLWWAE